VKVLDFGLAKAMDPAAAPSPGLSHSPTITTPAMTQAGVILGTAAYMSPEQAKGRPADRRSDVWAFGCVLFEMLTGRRAFEGDDVSDTLASVLKGEPAWEALPEGLPAAPVAFLRRSMRKDPRQRVADVQDIRLALEGAFDLLSAPVALPPPLRLWQRPLPAAGMGLALVVVAALLGTFVRSPVPEPSREVVRSTIRPSPDEPLRVIPGDPSVAISPDGRHVIYNSGRDLPTGGISVRPLDRLAASRLAELPPNVDSPFMSPDSEWLAFDDGGSALRRVPLLGGPPQLVGALDGALRGASWGENDTIVFATVAPRTGLFEVAADGGEPEPLTTPADGEGDHLWPEILPGGRAVLFTIVPGGSVAEAVIAVLDLDTRAYRVVIRGGSHAKYVETGHVVYGASGTLRAVAFDLGTLEARGTSRLVVDGVRTEANGAAHFGISRNGSLVYIAETTAANPRGRLVWVSRDGREEPSPIARDLEAPRDVRLSPDGQRVAVVVGGDVWVHDVAGRPPVRVTTGGGRAPLWTPDGQRILYSSRGLTDRVFSLPADGDPGAPVRASPEGSFIARGWSGDGGTVIAMHLDGPQRDIVQWPLAEPDRMEPVVRTPAYEGAFGLALSPDGRWPAYASDRDGSQEIFVQPYPGPGAARRVSPAGGQQVVWARDGRELFYLEGSRLMAVGVDTSTELRFTAPTPLFDLGPGVGGEGTREYDAASDGRFLVIRFDDGTRESATTVLPEIVLVQHWVEELQRLVPVE